MSLPSPTQAEERKQPTFCEALKFWFKLGMISFGGPAAQISIMHQELVERKKWILEKDFLTGLNYCMLLPGPEAQQLATYCGWRLHGTWGGIISGSLFVLPAAVILWVLSAIYAMYGEVPIVASFFYGLKPAVVALVLHAILRMGGKVLKNRISVAVCIASFIAMFVFKISFPWILISAAMLGMFATWKGKNPFLSGNSTQQIEEPVRNPTLKSSITILTVGVMLWWFPIILSGIVQGWSGIFFKQGIFYAKTALMTFGGAYAILPHVAHQVVEKYAWMTPEQMIAGLALSETTPGPLIMVLQYFGFIASWNAATFQPLLHASWGAFLATWATFVPSFIFILLGAPYIWKIQRMSSLSAALNAITATVVGVMVNLGVWLGWEIFIPQGQHVDWKAVLLGALVFMILKKTKIGVAWIILSAGICGWIIRGIS